MSKRKPTDQDLIDDQIAKDICDGSLTPKSRSQLLAEAKARGGIPLRSNRTALEVKEGKT